MNFNVHKIRQNGFTLIEVVISLAMLVLLSLSVYKIITYQNWSRNDLWEISEVQNEFRNISTRITNDVRRCSGVENLGSGTGPTTSALILEEPDGSYIWYFYSSGGIYRGEGSTGGSGYPNVTAANSVRISNTYKRSGATKGYIRSFNAYYKNSSGTTETDKSLVRRVEYILKGSYWNRDNPNDYLQYHTSAYIRIYS
ncbi:MAG: prepilin-type N-terminal cleavage/methylation domain-containing protein [Eubacteriales bacterium]